MDFQLPNATCNTSINIATRPQARNTTQIAEWAEFYLRRDVQNPNPLCSSVHGSERLVPSVKLGSGSSNTSTRSFTESWGSRRRHGSKVEAAAVTQGEGKLG